MVLRATLPVFDGWTGEARIATEHPASCCGGPVLLIEGEPVDTLEADLAGYEILDATVLELGLLYRGGSPFKIQRT